MRNLCHPRRSTNADCFIMALSFSALRLFVCSTLSTIALCLTTNAISGTNKPAAVLQGVWSSGHLQELVNFDFLLNGQDCELRVTRIRDEDRNARVVTFPCHVPQAFAPFSPAPNGSSRIVLRLPDGPQTLQFQIYGQKVVLMSPLPSTTTFKFPRNYRFMPVPLPSVEVNVAAHPAVSLRVEGLDCNYTVKGHGSTRCLLNYWSEELLSVVVSHRFLEQPDLHGLTISVVKTQNGWVFQAPRFGPSPPPPPPSRTIAANDHRPPLFIAIGNGDVQWVEDLIANGADVNADDGNGNVPLAWAVVGHQPTIATMLIKHGAKVNWADRYGNSILELAIGSATRRTDEFLSVIQSLIAHGADVSHVNKMGITPLMYAASMNEYHVAEILLAHGANVNAETTALDVASKNAYDFAAIVGAKNMMDLLVRRGVRLPPNEGAPAGNLLYLEASHSPRTVMLVGLSGAASAGETVTVTNVIGGQHVSGAVKPDGSFAIEVAGSFKDTYAVQLDRGGKSGDLVYLYGNYPAVRITLDSPIPGTVVASDDVAVTGTYAGPPDMSIRVGDRSASLFHGRFVASYVSLNPGTNSLSITGTTLGGLKEVQTLAVTSTAMSPLHLNAHPPNGSEVASLEMEFIYQFMLPSEVRMLKISYLGSGQDDFVTNDPAMIHAASIEGFQAMKTPILKYVYPAPGIYSVKLTVIDSNGATYKLEKPVVVVDPTEIDMTVQSVWQEFIGALSAGNRKAAMNMLSYDGREKLGPVLDELQKLGKGIASSFSPLKRLSIKDGEANYAIQRISPGSKDKLEFVTFTQYPDDVWRIDWINPDF